MLLLAQLWMMLLVTMKGVMTLRKSGALFALLATLVAVAGVAAGTATTAVKDPIVIGWAYDTTGSMAAFDTSAVASDKTDGGYHPSADHQPPGA